MNFKKSNNVTQMIKDNQNYLNFKGDVRNKTVELLQLNFYFQNDVRTKNRHSNLWKIEIPKINLPLFLSILR